jgi:hypothetical protein
MSKSAIFAIAAVAAVNAMPGSAIAERYYPWCAWYDDWTSSCGFVSREQCLATISGVGGICKPNPYSPPAESPRGRRRY